MDCIDWKKISKGDRDVFEKAIWEVKNDAYRVAYCYMRDENDAMDCVCNAIVKAFINSRRLKEPRFFKTWFIRIVINECKIMLRKKERVLNLSDTLYAENYETEQAEIMDLKRLLDRLPKEDRTLIYMKFYLGYTLDEISEIVNKPLGTVKTRIYGNLKKLEKELRVEEV